ncbi:hypothetical protein PGT21_002422 [Puccinia graminis f. sp. tritici]|nr:hypothetical protein PGT21_002422 [Puccinia graminis f. sp. tritici]
MREGLRSIVDNCQAQLGRPLTADELTAITLQARSFFDAQSRQLVAQDGTTDGNLASVEPSLTKDVEEEPQPATQEMDQDASSKPPYPSDFYELAKLISSSPHGENPNDLLNSLLNQKNLNLNGLKTIPNKLNDQKPSSPILATQVGAGKKPWEASP